VIADNRYCDRIFVWRAHASTLQYPSGAQFVVTVNNDNVEALLHQTLGGHKSLITGFYTDFQVIEYSGEDLDGL
jgi:hypothetical protein